MNQSEQLSLERRIIADRRKFNYTAYSPERRSGRDRRTSAETKTMKVA